MATSVLAEIDAWFEQHVFEPLRQEDGAEHALGWMRGGRSGTRRPYNTPGTFSGNGPSNDGCVMKRAFGKGPELCAN